MPFSASGPIITAAPAFRRDGLLIVTFDEADVPDPPAATDNFAACCHEPAGPNSKAPGLSGPGGGRVGAVLLSPFIKAGTRSSHPYNHYSMLKSVEEMFGLPPLGYAGQKGLSSFGRDVFTAPSPRG